MKGWWCGFGSMLQRREIGSDGVLGMHKRPQHVPEVGVLVLLARLDVTDSDPVLFAPV